MTELTKRVSAAEAHATSPGPQDLSVECHT